MLLVLAIVFSHPCLALGGASLCTHWRLVTVFATIARRLPSAFILVYLVIPPCSLKSVLGRLFILLGVSLYVGVSCMLHWAGVGLLST